jgi:Zn-dependent protease
MKCQKCSEEVFLPFKCPYCGGYFCPEHRLPESHDCQGKELAHAPSEKAQPMIIPSGGSHSYTISYEPTTYPRRRLGFSRKEVGHLLVGALLVTGVGLSYAISLFPDDYALLAPLTLILLASFFIHELAHKITAQRRGLWAEFRLIILGAVLTLFSILSPLFKIISPGAVMISGHADTENMGKISIAGPATNIGLATAFLSAALLLPPYDGVSTVLAFGAAFNAWIALFNLIPIGILDGYKIFRWNKKNWALAFAASAILTLISYELITL